MKIVLIGFGVVGQSLVRLLKERAAENYREEGLNVRIVGVADSRGAAVSESGLDADALLAAKLEHGAVAAAAGGQSGLTPAELIEQTAADLVVEATPTDLADPRPAFDRIRRAFRSGRHVVTVNKAPLATAMPALLELAGHNRVQFRFSGTVGGGTPMLALARHAARGDQITGIRAILNGTTNYILSRMHDEGLRYDDALAEATRLGYAETDPSADVDGIDAAVKAVIIANWVMGRAATMSDVDVTGIRGVTPERISAAAQRGRRIKLIVGIGDSLTVKPEEIAGQDPLNVAGSLSAMTLSLRTSGDVTLIGRGAGGPETATAILRDILDIWHEVSTRP